MIPGNRDWCLFPIGRAAIWIVLCLAVLSAAHAHAAAAEPSISIPNVAPGTKRLITLGDVTGVRQVASLTVSPDGTHYAALVFQGDPAGNAFRAGWFVGATGGGPLVFVGDGGEVGPTTMWTGHVVGTISGGEARWSPDGGWIAYIRRSEGAAQIWAAKPGGAEQRQLTHAAGDVRTFAWDEGSRKIRFRLGPDRARLAAEAEAKAASGYRYDEDLWQYTDLLLPHLIVPPVTRPGTWLVDLDTHDEHPGDAADDRALTQALAPSAGPGLPPRDTRGPIAPTRNGQSDWAWQELVGSQGSALSVHARLADGAAAVACPAEACSGHIRRLWWSADGGRVWLWRNEGLNHSANAFYGWDVRSGRVSRIALFVDDDLSRCDRAQDDRLVCVRESAAVPPQIVTIDLRSGRLAVLADLNPEYRNVRLGRVERFEWRTPHFAWNVAGGALAGAYAARTYGYIYYPPDFDPSRLYPVFVDPYVAKGFNPLGGEHALHVYAANGIIVLRTAFPEPQEPQGRRIPMKRLYDPALDFPHLSMLAGSTFAGIDAVLARHFIDPARIGIGGVSHGSFVPLYMIQQADRIAAVSISSPNWGPLQYYNGTRKARDTLASMQMSEDTWLPKPDEKGRAMLSRIDIADHVDAVEAPILMHFAAAEAYAMLPLIRNLADADKPYDAYLFPNETHIKWQPAHLAAILSRNLDWFRFWLQDKEDPDPAKNAQYASWRRLRDLQCRNSRSVRNFCR